jgi:hypothetical protein
MFHVILNGKNIRHSPLISSYPAVKPKPPIISITNAKQYIEITQHLVFSWLSVSSQLPGHLACFVAGNTDLESLSNPKSFVEFPLFYIISVNTHFTYVLYLLVTRQAKYITTFAHKQH